MTTAAAAPRQSDVSWGRSLGADAVLLGRGGAYLGLFNLGFALHDVLIGQLLVLVSLLYVPGHLLLTAMQVRVPSAARVAYSVGLSIALVLVAGLVGNTALPWFGVPHPLAAKPLVCTVDVLLLTLSACAATRPRAEALMPTHLLQGLPFLLLVVGAVAAAERLNNGDGNTLAVLNMIVVTVVVVGLIFMASRLSDVAVAMAVYGTSSALLMSYSLRGVGPFGYDAHREMQVFRATESLQVWHPVANDAYAAMLSITMLPTILSRLSGLDGLWVFKAVFPLLGGLLPVIVFLAARRWLDRRWAAAAASLLLLQPQFGSQLPGLGRQTVALIIFATFWAVAVDASLPKRPAQGVLLLLGVAITLSHYSTADLTAITTLVGVTALSGALRRQGVRSNLALTVPLAVCLAAFAIVWRGPVTHSSGNATSFLSSLAEEGPNLLPNRQGGVVQGYLKGNTTRDLAPDVLTEAANEIVAARPWLKPYPAEVQAAMTETPTTVPDARTPASGLAAGPSALRAATAQLFNLLQIFGLAHLLVRRRRSRTSDPGLLVLATSGAAFAGVEVLSRFSGTVASAYNLERLVLQGLVLLAIPACLALSRLRRGSRLAIAAGTATILSLAGQATGLTQIAFGGSYAANTAASGAQVEYYVETPQDKNAVAWLQGAASRSHIVFSDAYAGLYLRSGTDFTSGLFSDLIPQTLDQRAWVFSDTTNLVRHRGRIALGGEAFVFAYPTRFFDDYKSRLYDGGGSTVYG